MTILVTGSTGRIGPQLVDRLLAEGNDVAVLTRRPFRADSLFGGRVAVHEWHPGSEDVPAAALDGVTAVIHMMSAPFSGHATAVQLERIRASRVVSTGKLVAALGGRVARLVEVSLALPAAGSAPGSDMAETMATAAPGSPLAADILAAEAAALAGRERGLSVAVARLGLILAPGEPWARLVRLARHGLVPSLAGALVPVIDPEDAVAMLAGLASRGDIEGVVHGVCPSPLTGQQLLDQLASVRRLPMAVPLPGPIAARLLGPLAPMLQCNVRIVPQRLVEAGARFAVTDPLPRLSEVVAELSASSRLRSPLQRAWPSRAPPAPQGAKAAEPGGAGRP